MQCLPHAEHRGIKSRPVDSFREQMVAIPLWEQVRDGAQPRFVVRCRVAAADGRVQGSSFGQDQLRSGSNVFVRLGLLGEVRVAQAATVGTETPLAGVVGVVTVLAVGVRVQGAEAAVAAPGVPTPDVTVGLAH